MNVYTKYPPKSDVSLEQKSWPTNQLTDGSIHVATPLTWLKKKKNTRSIWKIIQVSVKVLRLDTGSSLSKAT